MSPSTGEHIDRVELVEGYGIRWRAVGEGAPVVWAHDALSSIDDDDGGIIDFDAIARASRLIRFDAVGHGRSAGVFNPADHEWQARGDNLVQLSRSLELERFAAGGLGAGAVAALYAAVTAPSRVERLIIAAPPVDWSAPGFVQRLPSPIGLGLIIGSAEPMRLVGRCAPSPRGRGPVGAFNAARWRRLLRAPRNQFNAVLIGAARSELPTEAMLAAVRIPALVLALEGAPTHPVRIAERIAAALPDSRLEVATDADEIAGWGERIATFLSD